MRVFLAMLKDSFREARDSKILYVLLAFSVLFSLTCLSVGLKDQPYEEGIRMIFGNRWGALAMELPDKPFHLAVPNLESVEERDQAIHVVFTVGDLEPFQVYVPPVAGGTGLKDFGGGNEKVILLKGERGFRQYLARRLFVYGFIPHRMKKTKNLEASESPETLENPAPPGDRDNPEVSGRTSLWELQCKPLDKFRTTGGQSLTFFFGLVDVSLGGMSGRTLIAFVQGILANGIGGMIGVLIAVVVTAWFFPNMLRKGSIDLLLARPVHRWKILVFRYLGGLTFVFLNASFLVGGTWLGLAVGTGYFHGGYLLCVVTITLLFAIVYSVSCLAGVLFRNVVLCIIFPVGFWFFCYLVTQWKDAMESPQLNAMWPVPLWLKKLSAFFYYVFPSTNDLGKLNSYFLTLGEEEGGMMAVLSPSLEGIDFTGSILSSLAFIAVVVVVAAYIFHRKDY